MCVLCYSMGSGIGDAVLFGGPFAFTIVRKVKAHLAGVAPDAGEPAVDARPEPPAEPARPAAHVPSPTPA